MSEYRIADLSKLVKDGIQIVQSLQEEQEAKRARSASESTDGAYSERPEVQPRTKLPSADCSGHSYTGGPGISTGDKQESSEESCRIFGHSSSQASLSESDRNWRAHYHVNRDDKNPIGDNNGDGGANIRSDGRPESDRAPMPGRNGEPQAGGSSGSGDHADYATILDRDVTSLLAEEIGPQSVGMEIKEATESDIEEVLSQSSLKCRRRLRGMEEIRAEMENMSQACNPVKKGIEESTVLTTLQEERMSDRGVTRSVLKSEQHRLVRSVSVGTVPNDALDVKIPDGILSRSDAMKDYAQKTLDEKVEDIIYNQRIILTRLQEMSFIKEEVMDIKRLLTNHSITLSTIEGYISSLMIVIPGSGRSDNDDNKEVNPDLKPVIGRERTRGLKEISEKKITITADDLFNTTPNKVDKRYLQEELDFKKNNAANFVPDDEIEAMSIIIHMIETTIGKNNKSRDLIRWVREQLGHTDIVKLYELISDALENYTDEEYQEDNTQI
ncbi:phosphoprotein [Jeilongvirus chaetodipodis]|uniref:Phosphoprotein n=1 Tax=Paramyxoviridae sp. TaxID=1663356 RepID=A0AC61TNV8_9MONO|nr:phosphoprotein [Paramyxoviridae sp.]